MFNIILMMFDSAEDNGSNNKTYYPDYDDN